MLEQIRLLSNRGLDFAFETTLSGKGYVRLFHDLKKRGYKIHLFFLWIHHIDIALERIAERVAKGGHNVPEHVVRRRFNKGLTNFFKMYRPLADSWTLIENSTESPYLIAFEEFGKLEIIDSGLFSNLSRKLEE